ncbi:MAG: hypothetical protein D6797_00805 [Bdellovibrio sp.]|nr:MAG: hypothetical protein D6797_00805 [Bdellovibrio sp.]
MLKNFFCVKKHLSSNQGYSLNEVMVATFIASALALVLGQVTFNVYREYRLNKLKNRLLLLRSRVEDRIISYLSWRNTMQNAENLNQGIFTDASGAKRSYWYCVVFSNVQTTAFNIDCNNFPRNPYPVVLYNSDNTVFFDPTVANAGFDEEGNPCYDRRVEICPFKASLTVSVSCNSSPCIYPKPHFLLTFNPSTFKVRVGLQEISLNTKDFNLDVERIGELSLDECSSSSECWSNFSPLPK